MKKTILLILALLSFAICYAAPKPYTYYEITKVKDYRGLQVSQELINSICLGRLIHFGSIRYDFSHKPFAPGSAMTSMGDTRATFFDMYDENDLIIPNTVRFSTPLISTKWGEENLHWFPYRGSSDFFSPRFGTIVCETKINGKNGEIIFRTESNQSVTLSVKECKDSTRKKMLDVKGIWDNYYPFMYKLFTVDGTIEYQRAPTSLNGQWTKEREAVSIDLVISNKNQCYIMGFRCIQQARSSGSYYSSLSRRDAGFSKAKPVKKSKQFITCLPANGDRFGFVNARSLLLSLNLSEYSFTSVTGDYNPYPHIYSHEIIISK